MILISCPECTRQISDAALGKEGRWSWMIAGAFGGDVALSLFSWGISCKRGVGVSSVGKTHWFHVGNVRLTQDALIVMCR